jgi:hypothetical protein
VLYAALESLDTDNELAALSHHFGMVLTAAQLGTSRRANFENGEQVLGRKLFNELAERCNGSRCKVQGKRFTLHEDGLFDAMSDGWRRDTSGGAASLSGHSAVARLRKSSPSDNCLALANPQTPEQQQQADSICFGMCGPVCVNPRSVRTAACVAHDLCVCEYGQAACVFTVPDGSNGAGGGCIGCGSLISAIYSWFGSLFGGGDDRQPYPPTEPQGP